MRVSIRSNDKKITIPVPLLMGTLAIRCIPSKHITKEQRRLAIESFKAIKKSLKKCKGMNIVDIETSSGEKIIVRV